MRRTLRRLLEQADAGHLPVRCHVLHDSIARRFGNMPGSPPTVATGFTWLWNGHARPGHPDRGVLRDLPIPARFSRVRPMSGSTAPGSLPAAGAEPQRVLDRLPCKHARSGMQETILLSLAAEGTRRRAGLCGRGSREDRVRPLNSRAVLALRHRDRTGARSAPGRFR
jgi:hypothetical protein